MCNEFLDTYPWSTGTRPLAALPVLEVTKRNKKEAHPGICMRPYLPLLDLSQGLPAFPNLLRLAAVSVKRNLERWAGVREGG
ncbi:hypothetical protein SKAU_G00337180 [Synaphobranchus kaupii]|uniref:Uncharacterized protein n=1 Tax=Synaphobranchus kaupii TaxID=118154 RepID=A0A9Q1EMB1_SYNKA|nr:hypothetical protein SKAU_G00337180 [Synaphobranchus kaupii]